MGEYKVRITDQAKEHLNLIKSYIVSEINEPKTAKKMLALLKENMKNLSFMPYRIKCIDEQPWGSLGFRKIRVKNYYIYFWVEEESKIVHIIAVVYTRMDQKKQLGKMNDRIK
ncbi:MAG: type II toxin-antitoxin system RelE/ParE family toxin [Clostridiales bacterium]|nr:type II toxin-antitoxin system RelE/ParE family toxin [Clostridiales bacterium]MBS5877773.1 type II toxin-antitoxin system RelE/ParE family toxin [Clostridiales bacterium]